MSRARSPATTGHRSVAWCACYRMVRRTRPDDTGTGANNELYACDLDDAGRLVIARSSPRSDGVSRRGIARLNTDGSVDTGFAPGAGMNGAVFCVNHQRDGKMLLGELFTAYNGSVPAPRIARLNSDGSFDGSFMPGSGFNSWVYTIVLQGDERTLAGGDFTSFNGNTRGRMVRLNTDGTLDTGMQHGDHVQQLGVRHDLATGGQGHRCRGIHRFQWCGS